MKLIGITGLKRSGKGEVGVILASLGYQVKAFADPIKRLTLDIDPLLDCVSGNWPIHLSTAYRAGYTEDEIKEWFPEYRRFLQRLGTEAFRSHDENFWIDWLFREVDQENPPKLAITDVRFPNEAAAVRERGGALWRVEREKANDDDSHLSERFISGLDVDAVICNNGTLEELAEKVEWLVEDLEKI